MPELPDLTVYCEAIARRTLGQQLLGVRLRSAFVLRTVEPGVAALAGRRVTGVRRLAKQLVLALEGDLHVVLHLMLTGRLHWKKPGAAIAGKTDLAAFDFADGTLTFTESAQKKRASMHLVQGAAGLLRFDPGGAEVDSLDAAAFAAVLARTPHTLKRALTDQRVFAGIGNAYSDEILHRARLSPFRQCRQLDAAEAARLHAAVHAVLGEWTARLRAEAGDGFPAKVTAFRPEMAVHGRYRQPCPDCGAPVQRIVHAETEANYCARCQTGGRLLQDRALSRLLHADWPRTLDELEQRRER
jgi:formamidopyrimidine-DNA glycosylase